MPVSHVTTQGAAVTTATSAITFASYVPALNDLVIFTPSSQSTVAAVSNASLAAAGWFNPLGDAVEVNGAAHGAMLVGHWVTQAEVDSVDNSYSVTAFAGVETGYVVGDIWRGVDPAVGIRSFGTSAPAPATPHPTASVLGTGLVDGDQVMAHVIKDGTGSYGTPTIPGWTVRHSANTNQGRIALSRDALTVASTAVASVNVTPSASDDWIGITYILAALADGTPEPKNKFFQFL